MWPSVQVRCPVRHQYTTLEIKEIMITINTPILRGVYYRSSSTRLILWAELVDETQTVKAKVGVTEVSTSSCRQHEIGGIGRVRVMR